MKNKHLDASLITEVIFLHPCASQLILTFKNYSYRIPVVKNNKRKGKVCPMRY